MNTHLNLKYIRFAGWTLYCWWTAIVTFFIPFVTLNGINNSTGQIGGLFTNGLAAFSCVIYVHHIMICIFTRNWTFRLGLAYIISFLMFMPLLTVINDIDPSTTTYHNVGDVLGQTALGWLSTGVATAIIVMPLYAIKAYEMVIKAPEFY